MNFPVVDLVSIGSNNGEENEPVTSLLASIPENRIGKVIFVEPQIELLLQLRKKWSHLPNTVFVERVISEKNGKVMLFGVRENSLKFFPGIGSSHSSIRKEVLLKHMKSVSNFAQELDSHISQTLVNSSTINHLLCEVGVTKPFLLQMDTEGEDGNILRNLDFSIYKPSVINFEHSHLTERDRINIYKLLVKNGYHLRIHDAKSGDTAAYLTEVNVQD